jgi:hypothetical protein
MDCDPGRSECGKLAALTADRIEDYIANGYRPLAVLGGNPKSPGCAVHHEGDGLAANSGAFMLALHEELRRRDIHLPFRGVRDYAPEPLAEDHAWLEDLLASS